jgi:gamma-aminobutyric acid type B receptor
MYFVKVLLALATMVGVATAVPGSGSASGYAMRFQGGNDLAGFRKKFSTLTASQYPTSNVGDGQSWMMWVKLLHPLGGSKRMFLLGEAGSFNLATFFDWSFGLGSDSNHGAIGSFFAMNRIDGDSNLSHVEAYDTWHHVAITHERVGKTNGGTGSPLGNFTNITYYIDGEKVHNSVGTNKYQNWGTLDGAVLGAYGDMSKAYVDLNVAPDHLNGWLDELAIYNTALSQSEIKVRMYKRHSGSETGLVMYYDFDDFADATTGLHGSGTTLAGKHIKNKVTGASNELDLVLGATHKGVYTMGPPDGTANPNVGSKICRVDYVNETSPGSVVYCDAGRAPVLSPSNLPVQFESQDPYQGADIVYNAKAGEAITITLYGADLGTSNTLTFTTGGLPAGTVGTPPGSCNGPPSCAISYTAPSTFTAADTFTYTVSSSGGGTSTSTVRIIPVIAPVALDITSAMVEDNNATVILASYDAAGLKNSFSIETMPANGRLFIMDGSDKIVSEITSIPTVSNSPRLLFVPQVDQVDQRSFTYKATNAHSVESAVATVIISVTTAEDIPAPSAPATPDTVTPGTLKEIDLGALTADPDSSFVTVLVESLPVHGTLYYENDATTTAVSKFDPFAAMAVKEQFASQIVETSTFWPSPIKQWHPDQALGVKDVFAYGDSVKTLAFYCRAACNKVCSNSIMTGTGVTSGNAYTDSFPFDPSAATLTAGIVNCPNAGDCEAPPGGNSGPITIAHPAAADDVCWDAQANHVAYGWSEYFTVKFDSQVHVKALEIGENRGMGAIEFIEAYDYGTATWQVIWSGEADIALEQMYKDTQQYRVFIPYPICETKFKTDLIKIKVDTIAIDDWNEYDYIKLSGTEARPDGVLESGKVYYDGDASATCIDNFKFSATDCGGQVPRTSSDVTYYVDSGAAAGSPNCVDAIVQPITALSTTFSAGDFSLTYSSSYTYEAVTDAFNTWSYDAATSLFTFDWASVDSDKNKYDVEFKQCSSSPCSASNLLALQMVQMEIPVSLVALDEDITFTRSDCTSSNEYEITYAYTWGADLASGSRLGGKTLPTATTYKCAEVPIDSGAGTIIALLAVLGTIFCGLFSVYIIVKAKHPVIKSSQPMFCIVFATGCALICLQILTFLGEATDATCALRNWLFNCLFTLAFGSIFAKTWRVWRVFSNTHLKKIRLTNMDTLKVMLILFAAEAIVLTLGQIISPYKATTEQWEFAAGRYIDVKICKSDTGEWHLLTMAYKVVLVFIGCYLSWTTRNVDNAFAESKYIMLAIYQIAIYGLVAAVVAGGDTAIQTTLTVQTVCCVFGAICCVCSVFLPKFLLIQSGQYDQGFKSGSQGTSLNTGGGSGPSADELEKLEVEIERLKGILEENHVEY